MAVTSLKHWIHLRRSSRCPPTSNILQATAQNADVTVGNTCHIRNNNDVTASIAFLGLEKLKTFVKWPFWRYLHICLYFITSFLLLLIFFALGQKVNYCLKVLTVLFCISKFFDETWIDNNIGLSKSLQTGHILFIYFIGCINLGSVFTYFVLHDTSFEHNRN